MPVEDRFIRIAEELEKGTRGWYRVNDETYGVDLQPFLIGNYKKYTKVTESQARELSSKSSTHEYNQIVFAEIDRIHCKK